jgi:tetratricopeptide (TPR) repeat protein
VTNLVQSFRVLSRAIGFVALVSCLPASAADQPQWIRVSSDHFIVLTDAGQKKGHEVAARFEQMRATFGQLLVRKKLRMSEPLEIIAIRDDKEYAQLAPLQNGQPTNASGFFLSGDDRVYVVLNLFEADSWRAVEHQLAHYLLNYNYPPTQPWFDEGFAEYFASLNFTAKQAELGTDPQLYPAYRTDLLGNQTESGGLKSFTEILSAPVWLTMADLFGMKNRVVNGQEGTHHTLFYAQSWMVVHYLLNSNKLSETGTYFELVENQKVPVGQAIQQAYGMTVAEFDKAVKDYFHSLKALSASLDEFKGPNPPPGPEIVYQSALPFSVDDVATSTKQVPLIEAQALVDEMELRIPERRERAFQELQALASDTRTETTVAHRALAWGYVQKNDIKDAYEELKNAVQINSSDSWTRYYLALTTYHSGEKAARVQGLANMMESLQIVIDEHPDFAEAYNMLGWARLTGGGANSAVEAMRMAVQLSPRNEEYQLRLARSYTAAKKWSEATDTLERLKLSENISIARAATKELEDMPFLRKFGVPPQEEASVKQNPETSAPKRENLDEDENDTPTKPTPSKPGIDKRPVHFVKGTLISVDCTKAPAAVLLVSQGSKMLKLRIPDHKSAVVIGAPGLSCEWKNLPVNVNYRAGSKQDGDLVSIEVH